MNVLRRIVLGFGLLFAAALLVPAGTAHADDCSSPSDCSNTAWTVAGGAAVAAAIVGAAMATNSGGGAGEGSKECDELAVLQASIRARYSRLADRAVLRQGAIRSKARAEAQLKRAREWAERLAREEEISTAGAGYVATGTSVVAADAGARVGVAESTHLIQRRLHDLIPGAPQPTAVKPAVGSGFWKGLNKVASVVGIALTSAGHYFDRQRRNNLRTLGILQQTIIQKQSEVERWRSFEQEQTARIEAGLGALREDVSTFNDKNQQHGCGWSRLDLDEMRSLLETPPDAEGAVGAVPQHILETEPPIRRATPEERQRERDRDRERFPCRAYDADLAQWNALVTQLRPKLDDWDRELRKWASRGAAVRRVMAERGQLERELHEAIWGASGLALGERGLALTEGGLAVAGLAVAGWPAALALGVGGILASVARGSISPSEAQLMAEGRLAAEMQFWGTRMAYINAEIARITNMRTEVLSELQRQRIRLDRTHDWCSQWWQDRGEQHQRAEPVPTSYRHDYTNFGAYVSPRHSAMSTPALIKEIRTWR